MDRNDTTQTTDTSGNSEQTSYVKRLSKEKQQKNIDEMLARPDDLLFVSPILEGFALKNKLWRKST